MKTTHISRALARRPPETDPSFAGVIFGALLGALCWILVGLVVWAAIRE